MNDWISVKDQLPDEEDEVLLLLRQVEHYGKHNEKRKIYRDVYRGYCIDGDWYTSYCHGYRTIEEEAEQYPNEEYEVTHWMPLPKLPNEAEKED